MPPGFAAVAWWTPLARPGHGSPAFRVPEGGRVDEAEVRRTLAALDLPPAIRTEVRADGGRVGVLLSVKGNGFDAQDCLLVFGRGSFPYGASAGVVVDWPSVWPDR